MASTLSLLLLLVLTGDQLISLTHSQRVINQYSTLDDSGRLSLPLSPDARAQQQLAQDLWNSVDDLKEIALQTRFISGVSQGSLSPEFYGRYIVQDAVWLREIANIWQKLANDSAVTEPLKGHAQNMSESYYRYSVDMFEWWQITSSPDGTYGVYLGPEAQSYVDFIASSAEEEAVYMLIATYPCLKLWPYLGLQCYQNQPLPNNCANVYLSWIEENKGEGRSLRRQEELINYYASSMNYTRASELFRNGMQCEIDFFNLTSTSFLNSLSLIKSLR